MVNGWAEPREGLRKAFQAAEIMADLPDDGNPFGPDPAMLASIGRPDDGHYYAPAPARPEQEQLPRPPVTAAGR